MLKYSVGTDIYYRGDMANAEGHFTITNATEDKWGRHYDLTEKTSEYSQNRTIRHINECMIDTKDTGNGMTRFCTEQAHQEYRERSIKQMQDWMNARKAKTA